MTAILFACPWWTVQLCPLVKLMLKYCSRFGSFGDWTIVLHAFLWLPLSRNHLCLRLQWLNEHHHWQVECQNAVFLDELCFNFSYTDGCIRVRHYRGEHNLRVSLVELHSRQTLSVVTVLGAIGYNMWSCLLHFQGNLNSSCYIRKVLEPEILPSFRKLCFLYFSRTMLGHMWQGLCKPSLKNDGYHCLPGLHIHQTCFPLNMSGIWMVSDLFIVVLQQPLLTLCGLI